MSEPSPVTPPIVPPLPEPVTGAGLSPVPMQDWIGQLHDDLAQARDEAELLATVVRYVARFGPTLLRLFYYHYDGAPQPVAVELVAAWPADVMMPGEALGTPFALANLTLAGMALSNPDRICVISDVATEPLLTQAERQRYHSRNTAAVIILPCYSPSSRTWQGGVGLIWDTPHVPGSEELFVYQLLSRMLPAFIANRRAELAHQQTLRQLQQKNEITAQLHAAQSFEQALQAVVTPFVPRGPQNAIWMTLHTDDSGCPSAMELQATWGQMPAFQRSLLGEKIDVALTPLAALWLGAPDQPLLVADVLTDERVDEKARAVLVARQRLALIILPLRTRGRWVGTISIVWSQPQLFSSHDHALCKALIGQAAIVFDNLQLMVRQQDTARERQRQTLALMALLDNMPVGVVVVDAATNSLQIINPRAQRILGDGADPITERDDFANNYKRYLPGSDQELTLADMPLAQTIADGKPHHREIDIARRDGKRVSLEVFSAPILDESGTLRSAMSLFVDISERKRAELERTRIQHEMITIQAAALAERSTPLIPITDEIIVLPLIGSLDTERGQQILDVLLTGVSQTRTKVAIIDVTGVRTLDTQAAQTLTQAARALRLLGVEPVLTGIRAEVAQTLVGLGVPLDGIATRSTLQSGIAYANRKKSR